MMYLGLGPDDDYEDGYDAAPSPGGRYDMPDEESSLGSLRPISARDPSNREPVPASGHGHEIEPPPRRHGQSTVRTIAPMASARPHTVLPSSFSDAQEIGDYFKDGQPVILNLEDAERELSRRLIDFASGLCYALTGHMEKIGKHMYLLTPADVEVSAEDRRHFGARDGHD
jgi:cell division inhibitor SepF